VRSAAERIDGVVLVQPMVVGAELLAGIVQDPVFGPLVGFGAGGVLAELIGDSAFRLAPITDVDAQELVGHAATGRMVAGFRGAAPIDASVLTDRLHRLSALASEQPAVAEFDLNPIIARNDRALVVDRRIRLRRPPPPRSPKSW
jgi:acyl-CoA synthetase (NDP forming)